MSTYSTFTFPSGSGIRSSDATREDLPAPVRPATPILSLSAIDRLMSFSTRGPPSMYLKDKPLMVILPRRGHDSGGRSSVLYPGSSGSFVYDITLSTDVMRFSTSELTLTPYWTSSNDSSKKARDIPAKAERTFDVRLLLERLRTLWKAYVWSDWLFTNTNTRWLSIAFN